MCEVAVAHQQHVRGNRFEAISCDNNISVDECIDGLALESMQ